MELIRLAMVARTFSNFVIFRRRVYEKLEKTLDESLGVSPRNVVIPSLVCTIQNHPSVVPRNCVADGTPHAPALCRLAIAARRAVTRRDSPPTSARDVAQMKRKKI